MELNDWRKLLLPSSVAGLAGYISDPDELMEGNRLTLLRDGREAYPAMLEAISHARLSIHLETYILRDDPTGQKFSKTLCERARAGVSVRLIFDAIGSIDLSSRFVQNLRNNGVLVLEYRPVAPWRQRWGWSNRDHRKILVIDDLIGFTGGLNIAQEYADPREGGGGWRDTDVRIEGPAAHELNRLFRAVWFRETGKWFDVPSRFERPSGRALVQVAANQEFLKRFLIRQGYLHAIRRAEKSILIATAYFIPDRGIRQALYDASARGITVSVLVPSRSDVPAVDYASRWLYSRHLRQGLRLYAWTGPILHAKTMAIDGVWSAVGSYNFTHRSLHNNLEVSLHILDKSFTCHLEESIRADIASSSEITSALWTRRPFSERTLEALCYLCRYLF